MWFFLCHFFSLPSGGDSVNVNAETATMKSVSGGKTTELKLLMYEIGVTIICKQYQYIETGVYIFPIFKKKNLDY